MAFTFSLVEPWNDGKPVPVAGTAATTGDYTTGGDTLGLSQFPIAAAARTRRRSLPLRDQQRHRHPLRADFFGMVRGGN
jgi:hypothetical protein